MTLGEADLRSLAKAASLELTAERIGPVLELLRDVLEGVARFEATAVEGSEPQTIFDPRWR